MRDRNGFSLIEVLVVIAIIGLTAGIATPHAQSLRRRAAVRVASMEIRAVFRAARMRAIARHAYTGVKFTRARGAWDLAIYDDGDRDGVRSDDIAAGTDRIVTAPRPVCRDPQLASVGLSSSVAVDPDGDAVKAGASPVQFGRSSICSFSPFGESTSGTIYLSDSGGQAWAVRVFGGSARVRLLRYDAVRRRWSDR